MKRIISLVITIAFILMLIGAGVQSGSPLYNGDAQATGTDSCFNTGDFLFTGNGLPAWQPYYWWFINNPFRNQNDIAVLLPCGAMLCQNVKNDGDAIYY